MKKIIRKIMRNLGYISVKELYAKLDDLYEDYDYTNLTNYDNKGHIINENEYYYRRGVCRGLRDTIVFIKMFTKNS
jgi:hypothetical protein